MKTKTSEFTIHQFKAVRGTDQFRKWFDNFRSLVGSERITALGSIAPHVVMTAYENPNSLVVSPRESNHIGLVTNRGIVHDYSQRMWTTELYPDPSAKLTGYGMFGPIEDRAVYLALYLCHQASKATTKFRRVFFFNDASGAVEAAIMLAWDLQRHKEAGSAIRETILCPEDSFFGSSLLGKLLARMSSADGRGFEYGRDIPNSIRDGVKRILLPSPKRNPDWFKSIPALGSVTLFISEIVQGVGGDVNLAFGIRAINDGLRKAGVYIVLDEASTAPGKTGSFFALTKYDLYADMVICGKGIGGGLPCAAILISDETADLIDSLIGQNIHFLMGRTLAGNSAVCAHALEHLISLEASGIIDRVLELSNEWRACIAPLQAEFPNLITSFRGEGTHYSLEFSSSRIPRIIKARLLEDGILVDTEARVLPLRFNPAVDTREDVCKLVASLRKALIGIKEKRTLGIEMPSVVISSFSSEQIKRLNNKELNDQLLGLISQYVDTLNKSDPHLAKLEPPYGIKDWDYINSILTTPAEDGIEALRGEFLLLFLNGGLKGILNYVLVDDAAIELHLVVDKELQGYGFGPKLYKHFIETAKADPTIKKAVFYNLPTRAEAALRKVLPDGLSIEKEYVPEGERVTILF